jgi:hypothetical protein
VEAAPRIDRRADDDELRAVFGRDARDLLAETSGPRADDLLPHPDAIRARHRGCALDPRLQAGEPAVHMSVDRQLLLDHERGNEDDAGAAIGREPAGEVERVLGLFLVEQRHDDAAVGDRARPARETPRAAVQHSDVGELHRSSW